NEGGTFRKWYGNTEQIINIHDLWNSDKVNVSVRRSDPDYYFRKAITWSYVTSGTSSFRFSNNKVSATAAPNLFFDDDNKLIYILGFLNTLISKKYLSVLNPTLNLNVTNVSDLPFIYNENKSEYIKDKVNENIIISKFDWDMHETSWDFEKSPLLSNKVDGRVETAYESYKLEVNERFIKLKENEEELNST